MTSGLRRASTYRLANGFSELAAAAGVERPPFAVFSQEVLGTAASHFLAQEQHAMVATSMGALLILDDDIPAIRVTLDPHGIGLPPYSFVRPRMPSVGEAQRSQSSPNTTVRRTMSRYWVDG